MSWIPATGGYIVVVGGLGVTTKYALRSLSWQEVIVWSTAAYAAATVLLLATGTPLRFHAGLNGGMAVITAMIAPASLCLLSLALRDGDHAFDFDPLIEIRFVRHVHHQEADRAGIGHAVDDQEAQQREFAGAQTGAL